MQVAKLNAESDNAVLIAGIGKQARAAQKILAVASDEVKNKALNAAADSILSSKNIILEANAKDMQTAEKNGISGSFLDRLKLDDSRIESMANGLRDIAKLSDPVGKELARWQRPNGLDIARISVPLGVIGVIYESRPNVTADAAALCLKSGNCAVLRGGSESINSSSAIMGAIQAGIEAAGLPKNAVQLIETTDRAAVGEMLKASDYIDVIVPRGGKGLIKRVMEDSRIPTFQHLDGNCHIYVHKSADIDKAVNVILNAKMRRTGICGAVESLVIDEDVIASALPKIVDALAAKDCEVRGDEAACIADSRVKPATDEDFYTEYLDAIISVKTVKNSDEAIDFISEHSSGHTDAIIAEDGAVVVDFFNKIDSAIVMHNASTQFADGGEFGMGAEIGIATGKLHARGPVGVEQLTIFKYVVRGDGQLRS